MLLLWASAVSKRDSGSGLGDESVREARGEGPAHPPSAPPQRPSLALGIPCHGSCALYPLMTGTLLAAAVSIKVPVGLLATK